MTMYRVRRRKARERRELTFHESFDLIAGPHRDRWGTDDIRWTTDAERREAWQVFGADILRRRVTEDRFARGARPRAFWDYDHPGASPKLRPGTPNEPAIDPREDGPYAHLRYEHMESASDAWWDDHLDRVRLEAGYLARRGLLEAHELRNIRSPHPRADGLVQPWDQAALDGLADAENTPDHDHDGGSR